ncbi:hypothetical protein WH50_07800 [Pokkaliibacter plantistimulans]|uniref:Uncharacterized protein n=1 Tax=Pokkaliibacter plantistimulans TaxID=1635171 RepID=A0ABX5LYR8_9GAMM|nr:hypothetical protein WH50_07800 [Pokkaliibacter plantistimulans]
MFKQFFSFSGHIESIKPILICHKISIAHEICLPGTIVFNSSRRYGCFYNNYPGAIGFPVSSCYYFLFKTLHIYFQEMNGLINYVLSANIFKTNNIKIIAFNHITIIGVALSKAFIKG